MGVFSWLKRTSGKAEETLDQTKKDISETATKIQTTLDESGKSVQTVVSVITIALVVSIATNIITIGSNISKHRRSKETIIVHNLYLGVPNGKN